MKVAVTGAAGFIGRHVLAELEKHSVDVVAVVRNAAQLARVGPRVHVVQVDLANPPPTPFAALDRPDVLIHLAWGGLPNYCSLHHLENELPNQYRFLANLIREGLPAVVATGTCFEYGMQFGPLSETFEARPNNPYGCAKDALRRQLEFLRSVHPFALTWARLFYVYGEGQAETSLLSQLKRTVERGESRFAMSGGEQLRDYLPVEDVAASLVALALRQADVGVVNVCSGKPLSVRALVERWLQENGWNMELDLGHYDYPDYEPMAFWGDRGKLSAFMEKA
jgi:nucleoside-diphosphate-sugar epimerase